MNEKTAERSSLRDQGWSAQREGGKKMDCSFLPMYDEYCVYLTDLSVVCSLKIFHIVIQKYVFLIDYGFTKYTGTAQREGRDYRFRILFMGELTMRWT